jgi:hypothetical protein
MNKSEVEGLIDLIEKDPILKQKFSKLITTIMEEDSALKTKLAEIVAKETRRRRYNV